MLKLGPYTLKTLETGQFALDGGAMFGIVPKTIWNKTNPADELNRIDMRVRALLIQKEADSSGPARNILIDCGMGLKWAEKFIEIYKIDHSTWSLKTELAKYGLKLEDITDVILTHLHFDHAGGMTSRSEPEDPTSELIPTFPNAQVYVQKRNWELAFSPNEKDRASYLTENYLIYKNEPAATRKLNLIETSSIEPTGTTAYTGPHSSETQILPGISVTVSNGHTLGMQIIRIADPTGKSSEVLYYCADLIPTATHVRVPFIMGYDCYPIFILQEKKILLNRATDEGALLFYEHCPRMHASTISRTAKGDFESGRAISL